MVKESVVLEVPTNKEETTRKESLRDILDDEVDLDFVDFLCDTMKDTEDFDEY